jgi:hypothetical protein
MKQAKLMTQLVEWQDELMLTTEGLSKRWGVPRGTLENWRCFGVGPSYIKLGKAKKSKILYRMADIMLYEKNHKYKKVD